MKGSKKVEKKRDATSTLKSAPSYQSPQSVKLKYGVGNSKEGSSTPVSAPTLTTRKSATISNQTKTTTSSTTNVSLVKPKTKPGTQETKEASKPSSTNQRPLPRQGECEICRQPCRSHCAGCKRAFYCSKQHQQSDWPKHKLVCRPFSIPTQYSSGFHLRPPGAVIASTTSLNSSSSNQFMSGTSLSSELQFMICTKSIAAGNLLFSEKPLMVTANVFVTPSTNEDLVWCSCCLKTIPNPVDSLNNNVPNSKSKTSAFCRKCDLPLCAECYEGLENVGFSSKFYGGQGHSCEECALICELRQKVPEVVMDLKTSSSVNNKRYAVHFMKDLSLLRVLMFRISCPWRWESLIALRNSPRYKASCKHNLGNLEGWLTVNAPPDYPVASYYLKNICKEKNILLVDIVKILAVFCETSLQNPGLMVLYENMSWLAHACTANTEQFFRPIKTSSAVDVENHQNNLEIVVKTVRVIDEGSKITMNYLKNYEGGRSALALKLFQTSGHYCCDTDCECYQQRNWDKTMGIRCDLVFSSHACSGILSPRVDAPNAEKLNLGMGMFMKSKKWECDKCKKFEKYESLHTKIMEIARDLTSACDRCCNSSSSAGSGGFGNKSQQSCFLQLQNKLLSNLSDQHWMVWKAKLRVLKSWTASVGYGTTMLRTAMSQSSSTCTGYKDGLIYVLKQKVDIYGEGIYGNSKNKYGLLELFARRHGQVSPKRGHLLFDAFFANLIVLLEDYKKELPITPGKAELQRAQVAREYCKKVAILRSLLEQTVESLKLTEDTTLSHVAAKLLRMAQELQEVFNKVFRRTEQRSFLIIGYLNDLLELYASQDLTFDQSHTKKSQLKYDPFKEGLFGEDTLEFEIDSMNLGPIPWFTFGSTTTRTVPFSNSSGSSHFTYDSNAESGFKYSSFDSPNFEASDNDSASDDDASDNPFIYSRSPRRSKTNDTNYRTRNSRDSASNGQNKSKPKPRKNADEDWSSYFWFSSDDDDENSNLFDDDEFDMGFTPSPRSTFGCDLFNDKELDELAEWATLQFIMGRMK